MTIFSMGLHFFQITDESKNVFAIEVAEDQLDDVSKSMYHHLKVLIEERDGYVEVSKCGVVQCCLL